MLVRRARPSGDPLGPPWGLGGRFTSPAVLRRQGAYDLGDPRVDAGAPRPPAAAAPGHEPDQPPVGHQRASAVPLTRVRASGGLSGAQHAAGPVDALWAARIGPAATVVGEHMHVRGMQPVRVGTAARQVTPAGDQGLGARRIGRVPRPRHPDDRAPRQRLGEGDDGEVARVRRTVEARVDPDLPYGDLLSLVRQQVRAARDDLQIAHAVRRPAEDVLGHAVGGCEHGGAGDRHPAAELARPGASEPVTARQRHRPRGLRDIDRESPDDHASGRRGGRRGRAHQGYGGDGGRQDQRPDQCADKGTAHLHSSLRVGTGEPRVIHKSAARSPKARFPWGNRAFFVVRAD
ncbi:hypothetical protein SGPA1_11182 [Streptomyces misionensis JCM 4497]